MSKPNTRTCSGHANLTTVVLCGIVIALLCSRPAAAIPCLSGFVRDSAGNPVGGGDLDFNITATGQRIVTPGDNTDVNGFYTVCVLPNVYDVAFAPPLGSHLMGKLVGGVDLRDDVGTELDIILDFGTAVTGTVRNTAGLVVGNVDVDVDRVEGGRLYTPGDDSDPVTGIYRVVIPDGGYRFRYEPPRGSRLRGAQIDSVVILGDHALDVDLAEGLLLQGRVTDAFGGGLLNVDIDLRDLLTGNKVFLANNETDAQGDFTVAAPAGDFEMRYVPPRASHQVAQAVTPFTLAGDVVQNQVLATGFLVTVEIHGAGGDLLAGADLDVKDGLTGAKLFTPHDRSDAAGRAEAVLPAGTYEIAVDPPSGVSLAATVLTGVTVAADTTIVINLEEAPRITVSGRVVDEQGAPVAGAVFGVRVRATGEEVRLADDTTRPDGVFALDVPPTVLDITLAPPLAARLVGRLFADITAESDTSLGDLILFAGQRVTVAVSGPSGVPVTGVDIDFIDTTSGAEIHTPDDNSDINGQVVVIVPAGTYGLVMTPPAQSGFAVTRLEPVSVNADTDIAVTLEILATGSSRVALETGRPNPFATSTQMSFRVTAGTEVTLAVFDLRGRRVRIISRGFRTAGAYAESWDGLDDAGARTPSGVYLVRLHSQLGVATQRILLVR